MTPARNHRQCGSCANRIVCTQTGRSGPLRRCGAAAQSGGSAHIENRFVRVLIHPPYFLIARLCAVYHADVENSFFGKRTPGSPSRDAECRPILKEVRTDGKDSAGINRRACKRSARKNLRMQHPIHARGLKRGWKKNECTHKHAGCIAERCAGTFCAKGKGGIRKGKTAWLSGQMSFRASLFAEKRSKRKIFCRIIR